ncbi:MAG: hypothetical protein A2131_00630 [Candidatus Sungbacteria bacterium GWC2_49_10]|uniref:Uncharacterized protein n=2 Tax=Parcubacteria group TaxID=1794811 RepID=A0A0G1ZNJ5_9BACT|nr:MAG: hypothetical protein UY60_C0009G0010 [Parcubacteria group bacterium GW2011_GWB1_50_9]KKW21019.1 MAG: hypothetical protein UY61_C0017G0006 [Candidatus Adlerbacteria bacterium GW2011_GWC1_50_9]OGZ93718.1 MAG: hypothetical protein A2131_00630 [Candidatus Sungbacteria bacterium GWC2_49_10]
MTSIALILADVFSGILFLASGVFLWRFLRERIPQALAIPDEIILERFREDAKKNRLWTLPLKVLYEEVHFWKFLRLYWARILYRIHIRLLRLDNRILAKYNRLKNEGEEEAEDSTTVPMDEVEK